METILYPTLADLYEDSIREYAQRDCFSVYGAKKQSYSGFAKAVKKFATLFKRHGLAQGDKIGLLGQNMPNWPAAYLAAVTSGMVIVPITTESSSGQISAILDQSEAKALVISSKHAARLDQQMLDTLNAVIRMDDISVLHAKRKVKRAWKDLPLLPETPAAILFTSGTTSAPKGVVLTHGNLCSQLQMVFQTETIYPDDIFVSILPLSHSYECTMGMLLPFMSGASVVYITRPPVPNYLGDVFKYARPDVVLSVPLIMEKICKQVIGPELEPSADAAGRLHRWFGDHLRFVGIGGAKLGEQTERFLHGSRFPYIMGYGMTEASPLLAVSRTWECRIGSTGPAMKGVSLKIDDPHPETGEGEILAKGANITPGYYNNPEATARAFTEDGWFRTRDAGRFDEDGYLYVEGRLDDVIVGANGKNIYPERIECIINSAPGVVDSFVKKENGRLIALVHFDRTGMRRYGIPPEYIDDVIEYLKKTLIDHVNEKVCWHSRISAVHEQVEPFEKTSSQKIKRFQYR